jgi:DNA-binding CsgD family transcriptional regulator
MKEKLSINSDLSHFLFLTLSMCWLMLFVFYAPDLGLLAETGGAFSSQNLFVTFYVVVILVGLFVPSLFTLQYYRMLTLIGVGGAILASVLILPARGVFRMVMVAVLGLCCGSFSYAGIVFILLRMLSFKWQIASVSYIVGINPLFAILIDRGIISFGTWGYWLLCMGLLLIMLGLSWFGFQKPAQKDGTPLETPLPEKPHRASLHHTRRMLWLSYGMVFVITLVTLYAFFISEKAVGDRVTFIHFYTGQILAGFLSFLLLFYRRSKLPLLFYGFLVVAFLGFVLMLLKDLAPVLLAPAIVLMGCAELGSILSWCLIPRVCGLWEAAHAFDSSSDTKNWSLRALRGFMLAYALAMLFGTFSASYVYQISSSAFFILSIASLLVLFMGNIFLVGFTRYQFFPDTGNVQVEGPVAKEAVRRLKLLSERETQVLGYILQGYSMPQISEKLFISLNTVKTHSSSIYRKLSVNSRRELLLRYLDRHNQETVSRQDAFSLE